MPEANVLYAVTAVVIAGLIVWVAAVLKTAKEPWARPRAIPLVAEGEEPALAASGTATEPRLDADEEASTKDSAEKLANANADANPNQLDADDTARATPMALSEGRAKAAAAAPSDDEEKT